METKISADEDFPHLAIYKRDDGQGPVYRIVFDNGEFPGRAANNMRVMVALLVSLAFWPASCGAFAKLESPWAFVAFAAACGALAWAWQRVFGFAWVKRVIELDKGADRLRVLKNGRIEIEKSLSHMLPNLVVADHPDAAFEAQQRALEPPKAPFASRDVSKAEKMHVLFGYFGAGHVREILVSRVEYPTKHSLTEVQQAIYAVRTAQANEPAATPFQPFTPPTPSPAPRKPWNPRRS